MPLLLADRAALVPPVPLVTRAEGRARGIALDTPAHVRIRSGVYAPTKPFASLRPWDRYAARVHAFARTHPDAVLCLESAAVAHGLPRFGETADVHVLATGRSHSRRFGDVCVHASADARAVERRGPLLVTSLLDTVADLARILPPAQALAVIDAAISPAQGGPLSLDALRGHAAGRATSRGCAQLRRLWEQADGRAESPAESVSRAVIAWCGYEDPELQQEFRYEGVLDRVDFLFPSSGAVGEADGWGKYDLEDPEKAAEHLRDEKRREDRLRRHRHPFARWELADAWKVAPLCRALDAAGVPLVRPREVAMLGTLQRRPREVARHRAAGSRA
ncbi:hypothetical protein [Microbacterium sp. 22242]|uniref:hypothetical protein n=1 Tax=Microbacterium sp. 22242 TaxID=3453896 RepID=UPI003F871EF4